MPRLDSPPGRRRVEWWSRASPIYCHEVNADHQRVTDGTYHAIVGFTCMTPVKQSTLGALSACLLLTGAAMASPSSASPGPRRILPTIPNGGARPISGVRVVLRSQPGSQADHIARQLMAPQLRRSNQSGERPSVLVATAKLGNSPGSDVLFIQIQSPRECGSAGCDTVSFRHTNGKWVKILDTVSGTIRVASTHHRGMPDLIVRDTDRRVWDGQKYAATVPPSPSKLQPSGVTNGTDQLAYGKWT
jgi:hypothetical protein